MPPCSNCGKKVPKNDEFCPHCGTRLQAASSKPSGGFPIVPVIIGLIILGVIGFVVILGGIGAVLILLGLSQTNIPTTITLSLPDETAVNTTTAISATLLDSSNQPIPDRTITFDYGVYLNQTIVDAITDAQGVAHANVIFNETGIILVIASFNGDQTYLASETAKNITVTEPSCEDGTWTGYCSYNTGYYCDENLSLVFSCALCGCSGNLVCYDNYCMTEEEKTGFLINDLQNSMVYVEHSYATGSGVIIAQDGDYTWILTNKHVVADADSISDVRVTTREQQTIPASDILVAPFDMDLAIIFILGTYGQPAKVNVTTPIYQGQSVMALGSPLGLQGSVSNGIISNRIYDYTVSSYRYVAIQTDAAINPGNSGGGLFLKSTGELIGINTFILPSDYGAEGLGLAIEVTSIDELPPPRNWDLFAPAPKCEDGTPYESCSPYYVGLYCSNGNLYNNCGTCGCDTGYFCPDNGECFTCPSGYSSWQDSYGEGFCCPPGTIGYSDGYCD